MKTLNALILMVALALPPLAYAQDTQPAVSAAAVHMATPTVVHKDPVTEGSVEEVIEAVGETAKVATKYFTGNKEGDKTVKAVGITMLVAALLKMLLSLLKITSPFWKETKGKWVLRLITLTVGAAAAILANIAGGMDWWNALIVFFSGPGSILVNEYQKMVMQKKE